VNQANVWNFRNIPVEKPKEYSINMKQYCGGYEISKENNRFEFQTYILAGAMAITGLLVGVATKFLRNENKAQQNQQFYTSPIGTGTSDSALNAHEDNYHRKRQTYIIQSGEAKPAVNTEKVINLP
jgi:hypothetical protein